MLAIVGLAPDAGKVAGFAPDAGCNCDARSTRRSLWARAASSVMPRCPPHAAGSGGEVWDGALRNDNCASTNHHGREAGGAEGWKGGRALTEGDRSTKDRALT